MRINILILLGCVFIIAIVTFLYDVALPTPQASQIPRDNANEMHITAAPDITLVTLDGDTIALTDYHGKIILLNFWATWCAPCVVEFPQMIELAVNNDDIVFVAVSVDASKANIQKFLQTQNQNFLKSNSVITAHDQQKEIAHDVFQIMKFPETIIIDKNGMMTDKIVGAVDWQSPEIMARITR